MSADENNKKSKSSTEDLLSANEIDEFTKALLDKKTEMALYEDVIKVVDEPEAKPEEAAMTHEEIKAAEGDAADALDSLRKERGQVPIDQEEEDYAWSQVVKFEDRFDNMDGGEDFTTESLFKTTEKSEGTTSMGSSMNYGDTTAKQNYIEETEKRPVKKKKTKSRAQKNAKAAAASAAAEAAKAEAKEKKPAADKERANDNPYENTQETPVLQSVYVDSQEDESEESSRKKIVWGVLILLILLALVGGGYYYKVNVYDPAHSATEEQLAAYNKLISYADEFSMLSDAEKQEMVDLLPEYTAMTQTQKDDLNQYFTEHTGKTYYEWVSELQTSSSEDKTADTDTDTDTDKTDEASDTEKDTDSTDSANSADSTDSAASGTTGSDNTANSSAAGTTDTSGAADSSSSYTTDNSTGTDNSTSSSAGTATDNSAEIARIQQEIAGLQADKANYLDFLASEGLSAADDDIVATYDSQIEYYQNLLNALQ